MSGQRWTVSCHQRTGEMVRGCTLQGNQIRPCLGLIQQPRKCRRLPVSHLQALAADVMGISWDIMDRMARSFKSIHKSPNSSNGIKWSANLDHCGMLFLTHLGTVGSLNNGLTVTLASISCKRGTNRFADTSWVRTSQDFDAKSWSHQQIQHSQNAATKHRWAIQGMLQTSGSEHLAPCCLLFFCFSISRLASRKSTKSEVLRAELHSESSQAKLISRTA